MAFDKYLYVQDSIERFRKSTGLTVHVEPTPHILGTDGLIRISRGARRWRLEAEVILQISVARLGIRRMRGLHERVLVTEYASPPLADYLKQTDTAFVDTAGNCYLNLPGLFLFVKGNKRPQSAPEEERNRAFTRSGLRVIFSLLTNPGHENRPFRDIAAEAGVSLGTVNWVMRGLKAERYLIEMEHNNRRLRLRRSLFHEWVTSYPRDLRPKAFIGRFSAPGQDWWNDPTPGVKGSWWGSEIAAARLAANFLPMTASIYVDGDPAQLIAQRQLTKEPLGNVELLQTFWKPGARDDEMGTVHPLLICADLISSGEPQNVAAATEIEQKHLSQILPEE